MGNPVVHWELVSKNPAKLAAFYESIFAWKIEHHPELNYHIADTGGEGGIGGGIVKPDRPEPWPANTLFYIAAMISPPIATGSWPPVGGSR
jgi:predicted enzyme related to lactoylglutathione lyase